MSVTTLSRQGAGVYRLSGLGIGLISALLCVGGIAPTPPVPPEPPVVPPIVVPPVPPVVPSVVAAGTSVGGGGGVSWRFESTPYERRARAVLVAPVGRMAASGAVVRANAEAPSAAPSARRIARLAAVASLPTIEARGYRFNLAQHNAAARRVLDEDDEADARLID